jgi:cytosine deaminase
MSCNDRPRGGLVLANATLTGGAVGSIRIVGDHVSAVGSDAGAGPDDEVVDLAGYVLLPGLVEPHVHLEKAFTAGRAIPGSGGLAGAIEAWSRMRGQLTRADVADRARRAVLTYLAHGATAIRAHTDATPAVGTLAVGALQEVRAGLTGAVDIEIVASGGCPLTGQAGRSSVAALRDAIGAGADVVGGAPWLDPDPKAAYRILFDVAAEAGLPVDLHVDETTDAGTDTLRFLIDEAGRGFGHPVTASHAVSLGSWPRSVQRRVASQLAEAGITVVTLPQTNLWLQGRAAGAHAPRGLTAVGVLRELGVTVAAGGDNIRDPFNPLGRADPLETASLLAAAAQLSPAEALAAVSADAWALLGRPAPLPQPGAPAAFVAVAADSAADAVAGAPPGRIVIRGDRVVARTQAVHEHAAGLALTCKNEFE